jgi:hypothetical protein
MHGINRVVCMYMIDDAYCKVHGWPCMAMHAHATHDTNSPSALGSLNVERAARSLRDSGAYTLADAVTWIYTRKLNRRRPTGHTVISSVHGQECLHHACICIILMMESSILEYAHLACMLQAASLQGCNHGHSAALGNALDRCAGLGAAGNALGELERVSVSVRLPLLACSDLTRCCPHIDG